MKEKIHPKYGSSTVQCVCGNVIETRSTKERIQVGICSNCHPFYTGRQNLMDTAGRIDRFKKKFGARIALGTQKRQKKAAPVAVTKKASALSVGEKLKKAKEKLAAKQK